MRAFDYLRTWRPHIRRVREIELSADVRGAVLALMAIVIVTGTAFVAEQVRLAQQIAMQDRIAVQLALAERRLGEVHTTLSELRILSALARQAHNVRLSGADDARALADIGNGLPPDVWLLSIARRSDGFEIAGEADDYATLGHALEALSKMNRFSAIVLRFARAQSSTTLVVDFDAQLRDAAR